MRGEKQHRRVSARPGDPVLEQRLEELDGTIVPDRFRHGRPDDPLVRKSGHPVPDEHPLGIAGGASILHVAEAW